MGNKKSKPVAKYGGLENAKKGSHLSNGAIAQDYDNVRRTQNALLIWLDKNIDENKQDCRNTIAQLRRVINDINTYTDGDQCIQFIKTITDNKACMVISGALGQYTVPRLHNMAQVDSIFIFCGDRSRHEKWVKEWPKIKGVFTEIPPICEALKHAAHQCEKNAISISFVVTNAGDASSKTFDRLDPSYMYTQILKEILSTIKFGKKHFKEFIKSCHDVFTDNEEQLVNVKRLEREYRDKTPIWWYTCSSFLYPMLNKALRLMDVDVIIQMGFFIGDLDQHIKQLHAVQFSGHATDEKFTVYRGQGLSKEDFVKMTKTKGGLISFNNFLSTSKNRNISLKFADHAATNPDLVGILFIMKIDPAQSTTTFASIRGVSYFPEEDEVLFSMQTVFRINDIKKIDGNNRVYEVELTLTSDKDQDLRTLTDRIREETYPDDEGWYRLGRLLLKLSEPEKAQEIYEDLLDQTTKKSEKADINHQLGLAKCNQGKYQEALTSYEKTLKIYDKIHPPTHLSFANCYNDMGLVYYIMGDNSKALSSYEKTLEIQQQSLPPNDPDLAASYTNIGLVYYNMHDYSKALSSHEKAFTIRLQSLPLNHPDLAASYTNIGLVHYSMHSYPKALASHEKAFIIRQQSLPPNHPDLAASYNNIGLVHYDMGDYSKALLSHEKALEIREQSLPSNHPDLAASYNNIGAVYKSMGNYSKACSSFECAVNIGQHSLPPNHPALQDYKKNLEDVKRKL
jgi:tetratricopeptide (TPR) repeat protein